MQRHGEQFDALRSEARSGGGGTPGGVVSIREQHEALCLPSGENRAREIQRLSNVGRLAISDCRPDLRECQICGGRLPKLRLARESENAGGIARALMAQAFFHEFPRFLALRLGNARGIIHCEQHGQFMGRQQPAHPAKRQRQQQQNDQPERKTHAALRAGHVRQRLPLRQEQEYRDKREAEEAGMRQFEHDRSSWFFVLRSWFLVIRGRRATDDLRSIILCAFGERATTQG